MIEAKAITSTVADGTIALRMEHRMLESPAAGSAIVEMEAASFNPSDQFLLLGTARPDTASVNGTGPDRSLTFELGENWAQIFRARLGQAMTIGNEGSGRIVAAGPGNEALVGQRVAVFGSGVFSTHYTALVRDCVPLPQDVTTQEASALFVNPLTALVMMEAVKTGGHRGIVQTAAASTLGQIFIRVCRADGVPLVNIVRGLPQIQLLTELGAEHVISSADSDFRYNLSNAIKLTRATIAFDAIGGGDLADAILSAMEQSESSHETDYLPYGSRVHKQLYVYGGLDPRPSSLSRNYGINWSIGGFFLLNELSRLGEAKTAQLVGRALSGIRTTFATRYAGTLGLKDFLDPDRLIAATRRGTGEKYMIGLSLT